MALEGTLVRVCHMKSYQRGDHYRKYEYTGNLRIYPSYSLLFGSLFLCSDHVKIQHSWSWTRCI